MMRIIYIFCGIIAGIALSGLAIVASGAIFIGVFGLLLFGDASDFVKQLFYVLIFVIPIVLTLTGAFIGNNIASHRIRNGLPANYRKCMLVFVLSVAVFLFESYAFISFNSQFAEEIDISTLQKSDLKYVANDAINGTYSVNASIKDISLECFCPVDVPCKTCSTIPYIVITDGINEIRANINISSKLAIDNLPKAGVFVIEKSIYPSGTFFSLVHFQ